MGEGHDRRAVQLVAPADALGEAGDAKKPADREAADRDDEARPQDPQLPLAPERAELLLAERRRAVSPAGRRAAGIATRHRGAVERRVELVLVQVEPAPERFARAATPWPALLTLDDTGSLAVHVRALVEVLVEHRP